MNDNQLVCEALHKVKDNLISEMQHVNVNPEKLEELYEIVTKVILNACKSYERK